MCLDKNYLLPQSNKRPNEHRIVNSCLQMFVEFVKELNQLDLHIHLAEYLVEVTEMLVEVKVEEKTKHS